MTTTAQNAQCKMGEAGHRQYGMHAFFLSLKKVG